MPAPPSHRRVLAALLVVGLLTFGCTDDGSGTTATTPQDEPAEVTTTSEDADDPTTTTTDAEAAAGLVLRGDGLGVADLGALPDEVVAAVVEVLGEPTKDTGWQPSFGSYGTCPGARIRGVEWDSLVVLFTDGDTAEGSGEHFFSWRVNGAPPAVGTASGFGYSATKTDAEELYPGRVEVVPAEEPFPALLLIEAEGGQITAFLDDDELVTNLEAGTPCGE